MKVGDLVTWTSRPDLREWPPPYRRVGLILQEKSFRREEGFEVLWLESQNTTWQKEDGLEVVSECR